MKTLLLYFLLFAPFFCFGQQKKFVKQFSKGNYDECLQIAADAEKKDKVSPIPAQWKTITFLAIYQKDKKEEALNKAVATYKVYKKKSGKNAPVTAFETELHDALKTKAKAAYDLGQKDKSLKYCNTLIAVFSDTIDLFDSLQPVKKVEVKEEVVQTEKATVYSSKFKKPIKKADRNELISFAETMQGVKYKWAGEKPDGFDCSGYVLFVMRKFGYDFYHGAKDQSELGFEVKREALKKGDLVFFGKRYSTDRCKIDHVAIVHDVSAEKLEVIHCTSKGVCIQELTPGDYWGKKILFFRNIIE